MVKIACLFPGQGSHYVGMSKGFYDRFAIAKQTFEEANDVLGYDLASLCFDGPLSELGKPRNAHPAILVSSVVCFRAFIEELGIMPQFLAGHSLGEYAAFTCAGAIRFDDALKLVHYRGILTEEVAQSGSGSMTIIDRLDRTRVEEECDKLAMEGKAVTVSCYNTPFQTAVSGEARAVWELEDRVTELGGQVTPLLGSAPFHSALMQQAADKLAAKLADVPFGYFTYPVITNVNAQPMAHSEHLTNHLLLHLTQPVQWERTIHALKRRGVNLAVEMGAKNVVTNIVLANASGMEALCYGAWEDRQKLEQIVSASTGIKKQAPTVIAKCLAVAAATPNQNEDDKEYLTKAVKSYRKIQEIQTILEETGENPTLLQMNEALELLKVILNAKKISEEEQTRWLRQIIDETRMYYEWREDVTMALPAQVHLH
ncbi:acyltransferase domain-containing protein [Paenibacillus dendritiformis]|uniref:ACP S-malonyltransferase n=1 Tax=Paenibacillus dendritiformis TaxID=130049 RepID=UPI00143DB87C|nr:acyltransferase domain-containing protein [Paenibacillus dendritiformis]NKI19658.1 acyltransferase domain-containing protein [Paenibacillus dendritiformis]NRF96373.1 acyltransferase domain-containing protein [Paenibacillus dendritiformis]